MTVNAMNNSKVSITTLKSGQTVLAGYKSKEYNGMQEGVFAGFKLGSLTFETMQDLKRHIGVKSLKDVETRAKELCPKNRVIAQFQIKRSDHYTQTWGAYLLCGTFRCNDLFGPKLHLGPAEGA